MLRAAFVAVVEPVSLGGLIEVKAARFLQSGQGQDHLFARINGWILRLDRDLHEGGQGFDVRCPGDGIADSFQAISGDNWLNLVAIHLTYCPVQERLHPAARNVGLRIGGDRDLEGIHGLPQGAPIVSARIPATSVPPAGGGDPQGQQLPVLVQPLGQLGDEQAECIPQLDVDSSIVQVNSCAIATSRQPGDSHQMFVAQFGVLEHVVNQLTPDATFLAPIAQGGQDSRRGHFAQTAQRFEVAADSALIAQVETASIQFCQDLPSFGRHGISARQSSANNWGSRLGLHHCHRGGHRGQTRYDHIILNDNVAGKPPPLLTRPGVEVEGAVWLGVVGNGHGEHRFRGHLPPQGDLIERAFHLQVSGDGCGRFHQFLPGRALQKVEAWHQSELELSRARQRGGRDLQSGAVGVFHPPVILIDGSVADLKDTILERDGRKKQGRQNQQRDQHEVDDPADPLSFRHR